MTRSLSLRTVGLLLLSLAALAGTRSKAQASFGLEQGLTPPLQVSGQVQLVHANAPPGQCGCFWMTGGGIQIDRNFTSTWSGVAEAYYASNGSVPGTDGQSISIFNYLFGPRYYYRTSSRYTPYGQALLGISRVGSNYYVYSDGMSALAAEAGLGVEVYVKPHIAVVPLEVNWVYSRAKNGENTRQNNTRIGIGVIYRFGR